MSSPIKVKSTKKPRYLGSFSYIPPGQILQSFIRIWRNVFFIRETKIPTSIEILYCKYIHTVYQVLPRVFIAFYWVSNTSYDHMSLYQIIKLGISQGYINHFVPKTIKLRLNATKLIPCSSQFWHILEDTLKSQNHSFKLRLWKKVIITYTGL